MGKVLLWNGLESNIFPNYLHCVKSIRIRSFSGPYFSTFGLNTDIYPVNLCIQSELGKIRTRKTPNTDTLDVVSFFVKFPKLTKKFNWNSLLICKVMYRHTFLEKLHFQVSVSQTRGEIWGDLTRNQLKSEEQCKLNTRDWM